MLNGMVACQVRFVREVNRPRPKFLFTRNLSAATGCRSQDRLSELAVHRSKDDWLFARRSAESRGTINSERTSFPKTNSEAACLARLPKAWPFSGQSMPLRRMRMGCSSCRTSMVSLSRTETTGPEKSAMARKGLNRNRREQRARSYFLPRHTNGGETQRRTSDESELSRWMLHHSTASVDNSVNWLPLDASIHSFTATDEHFAHLLGIAISGHTTPISCGLTSHISGSDARNG